MKPTTQLRIRLSDNAAQRLLVIPPRARSRVASILVASGMEKIDLATILEARRELVSLGNLLNQSLRLSWGERADGAALQAIIKKMEALLS